MEMHYFNSFDEAETRFRRRFLVVRQVPLPEMQDNVLSFEAPPIRLMRRDKLLLTRVGDQRRAYIGYSLQPRVLIVCWCVAVVVVGYALGWFVSEFVGVETRYVVVDMKNAPTLQTFDL